MKQDLISFVILFENYLGYNEKQSMQDLHQLIKHKIFDGDWDEFKSNWSAGLDKYDKLTEGVNTYEEGFDRMVDVLRGLSLSNGAIGSFLELTLEMYFTTSSSAGVIEFEINEENQFDKQHPNYPKFKLFEYLSSAMGEDVVMGFLVANKPKKATKTADGKYQIHIDDTDFTLWEVAFEISNTYEGGDCSFDEAKLDFLEKVGVEAVEEEEDVDPSNFTLTTEIQYYACDSGHGSNIINDCLEALKEDSPGFNDLDYEYKWNKLDYKTLKSGEEINMALDLSTQKEIEYKDGFLIGGDLSVIWEEWDQ